jgi:undecaprenyl pyrophosphate phosphatase UppP
LIVFGNFLWQILKGMVDVIQKKRIRGIELNHQVAIACSAMFVGIVILSIVSHTLYGPYWYVLGGLVAANRNILRAKLQRRAKLQAAVTGVPDDLPGEEQDGSLVGASTSTVLSWLQRRDFDE